MPSLLALMQTGAYTLNAQTIFPSATLPAHASMITGLCPSKHGVTWNDYIPENGFAQGFDLFDLAHAAGLKTVMYVGKEKLRQLTEPASTDIFVYINDRDQLLANFPVDFQLMFIHFPTADWMGHEYGWLSPEQLSVLFRADQALNKLLMALDSNGLRAETLLIITSDHGGHKTTHGSRLPEDMTIPWIISGPGVIPGQLTISVQTMDTAATAAYALGLPIPAEWDGIPVTEAFGLPVDVSETVVCP
jgi:predicted AlkP superfamily pyrophosphatase or phosphodiesterase